MAKYPTIPHCDAQVGCWQRRYDVKSGKKNSTIVLAWTVADLHENWKEKRVVVSQKERTKPQVKQ